MGQQTMSSTRLNDPQVPTVPARELAPYSSYVSGYAPYGAGYGAPNGGLYTAVAPGRYNHLAGYYGPGNEYGRYAGDFGPGYGFGGPWGGPYGAYGPGIPFNHTDRVANTEASARDSDLRFADQEQRRNNDLLLSDNFERRLKELEEPIRDLKSVCEQRVGESNELSGMLLPASTGAGRPAADPEDLNLAAVQDPDGQGPPAFDAEEAGAGTRAPHGGVHG